MASRTTETTNYEISRTTRHTIRPRGDVARLSVAVVVDDELVNGTNKDGTPKRSTRPRTPAELQKLQGLIAAAVGIDQTRGDQLTVENIAFDQPAAEQPPPPPTLLEKYGDGLSDAGRMLTILAAVAIIVFFVIRPILGRGGLTPGPRALPAGAAAQLPPGAPGQLRTVEEMQREIEAQLNASAQQATLDNLRVPVLARKASSIIQNEPENAARLLRTWLHEEES
jgi:flagellar M-ring protein FliF